MFDRTKAIDELINDDADIILGEGDYFLYALLKDGFKGYANYNDGQLMQELMERDIFRSVSNG